MKINSIGFVGPHWSLIAENICSSGCEVRFSTVPGVSFGKRIKDGFGQFLHV